MADTKTMPQQELEKYIAEFLKQNNMCVLATCNDDIPRATPIEYRSKGTALYFVGEQGTKLKNISKQPQRQHRHLFSLHGNGQRQRSTNHWKSHSNPKRR